jgi:hypothetical protein
MVPGIVVVRMLASLEVFSLLLYMAPSASWALASNQACSQNAASANCSPFHQFCLPVL